MFDAADRVRTDQARCSHNGCTSDRFWLFDGGHVGKPNSGKARIGVKCIVCKNEAQRIVQEVPTTSGDRKIPPLDGIPNNMLVCGGPVHPNKQAPDGICRGVQFRLTNRGNEMHATCLVCRRGDSLGLALNIT